MTIQPKDAALLVQDSTAIPLPLASANRFAPLMPPVVRILLFAGLLSLRAIAANPSSSVPTPPQGAALLKTDVLGIFAHPDDETGVAPLIADLALRQNRIVAHVYCTRGEGGGNMVGTQYGVSLGLLREAELRDCLNRLGVRFTFFLDREDFAYTESRSITLEKWGHEESLRRLVRLVRALRPEVILTMNPAPTPGQHGNHQAAGWLAIEAFDTAGDPQKFPEQLSHEGLTVWQPRKLYFGGVGPFMATLTTTNTLPDGRNPAQLAAGALSQHRSQAFGNFGNSPWFLRPQHLQLVQSVVPPVAEETDLFQGLPLPGNPTTTARLALPLPGPTSPTLNRPFFQPRPAVAQYLEFVRLHAIAHAAASLTPDIPVVAGVINDIAVQLPPGSSLADFSVAWPAGWHAVGVRPAVGSGPTRLRVNVPANATGDPTVTVQSHLPRPDFPVTAKLHLVPRLVVPASRSRPALDRTTPWPIAAVPISIRHTDLWEGKTRDAADSSAVVRILHDRHDVFLEIQVMDDFVVSNIAPNDIKGHWRSDSVELCFDPHPGSEHTLGCYKLGIFPFDSTGQIQAARDADAHPGLVNETAPGTRLTSWRTDTGYTIRAAIPLAEIGVRPGPSVELGFNVLIYDGDKTNAVPGENINKSRLAWAPRGGVQGRPEDWGRLRLESAPGKSAAP